MTNSQTISASWLTRIAVGVVETLPAAVRETLFQTKQEQTFSSLIASKLNSEFSHGAQKIALVEIRGKSLNNKRRNTHDIALLNHEGKKLCLVENKVWYHFDGAKGRRRPKIEKGVVNQLRLDIEKLKRTLCDEKGHGASGLILLNIVTPKDTNQLPSSYRKALEIALKREEGSMSSLVESGLKGIFGEIEKATKVLLPISHLFREFDGATSRLDVICAEVRKSF